MPCIRCFFSNSYQKQLKSQSFRLYTFIERLEYYRDEFLKQLQELRSIDKCDCRPENKMFSNPDYITFCEAVRKDFQEKIDYIKSLFNSLIDIFQSTIDNSPTAKSKLELFIKENCTGYSSNNAAQFSDLLFRARPIGDYDPSNICELFHIPFSRRNLVSSQRFSVAGRPMLYLAKSVPTTLAELDQSFDSLNYALFFPIYSFFLKKGMYNITNSIDFNLYIEEMNVRREAKIQYDNSTFTFSKENANLILGDNIFFQLLTFPKKTESEIIEEYVLPQLFTDHLENKGYTGLIYQSTKEIPEIRSGLEYTTFDYNYCFFIPDNVSGDYNDKFLGYFHSMSIGNNERNITIEQTKLLITECLNKIKESDYLLDEYIILLGRVDSYIEKFKEVVFNGTKYYESELGKIESTLIFQFLRKIENVVTYPQEHDIIKKNEISRYL